MVVRDLRLRYTYEDGESFTCLHRVWDVERFMTARIADGQKGKLPADRFQIEVVE
jgi:hypothetical protein